MPGTDGTRRASPSRDRATGAAGGLRASIARGRPDGNDSGRPAGNPLHELPLGRGLVTGDRLPSRPTISQLERRRSSSGIAAG